VTTFVIKSTGGGDEVEVEADTAEYDQQTGATLFKNGDELVARVLNVNFWPKPAAAPATSSSKG